MKININDFVKVRLTNHGIAILKERHEGLQIYYPSKGDFKPPKKDEDGYSKFQLWDLMSCFGEHIGLDKKMPIETEIIVEDES